jgi:exonuclease I
VEPILWGLIILLLYKKLKQYEKRNYPDGLPAEFKKKWKEFLREIKKAFQINKIDKLQKELDDLSSSGKQPFNAKRLQADIERALGSLFQKYMQSASQI